MNARTKSIFCRIIPAVAFCLYSIISSAQVFPSPSNSWGIYPRRGVFDSVLYGPTGCGAPTDSTFLFSIGFGHGQILPLFTPYYDSCRHHLYVWDPSLKAWHMVDSSSGGGGSDSGFQVLPASLAGAVPITKFVDGSGHRYILYDTTGSHPGAITTIAGAQKKIDSLSAVINSLLSAKFGLTDTGYTHTLSSVYTLRKVSDSLAAVYTAGLGTKFSLADTGYTKTLASINTLAKVRDSLQAINNAALALKVTNSGGAKILGSGNTASMPAASAGPGLYYDTDDSLFHYSNGSTWSSIMSTIYVRNAGAAGLNTIFPLNDSIMGKKLVQGTNITLTQNSDSSITISSTGGSGVSDSGFNVLNGSLAANAVPIQKNTAGSLRNIIYDTAANNPGAITTRSSRQKLSDSLQILIALRLAKYDTAAGPNEAYITWASRQKLADSLVGLINLRRLVSDTSGTNSTTTRGWLYKVADSLAGLISGITTNPQTFQRSPTISTLSAGQRVMTDPATDTLTVQPEIMHQPVHYIANAALAPNTYSNGTAGVGATLTGSSNGYLLVDGDTTVLNDRVLVDQEADSTHNGIYSVTTKGDASHAYVLTRTPFASVPSNMRAGSMVIADSGLTNQGAVFYQSTTGAITFGTTKLAYKALSLRPAANLADVPNKSLAASNLGIIPYQSVNVGFAAAGANPDYTVLASAILQPTNAFTLNGPITWGLITFGGHGASFFDSLYPDPVLTQRLDLVFPQVKSVLTVVIGNDESTQAQGVVIGPTVSFTSAQFAASMPTLGEAILTGNGTSTWSTAVSAGSLSISTFSTTNGQTSIGWTTPNNLTQFAITANTPIVYQGPNQYTIDRTYSGLGAYTAAFNIVEPNGGYLDTYPTANDKVIIGPMSTGMQALHLGIWTSTNSWLAAGANANFWVIGMFEAWMIASPVTSTTNQIKWQLLWPGATQYKIYRDVSMAFSSPTLVYTGNAGVFTDTGLTPGAVYYYKEMATVSGVDQFVTTFPCPTKPY